MANTNSNFVQPAIPKLNEHYEHWAMLMENFLRSKEYWNLIDPGIPQHVDRAVIQDNEKKNLDELKLKDLKRMNGHNSHEEQVLKVSQDEASAGHGRGRSVFSRWSCMMKRKRWRR
ncbi:retrovirus-related Pol polyprotein from transposon TNT 1-94 [Sesbania bispinosa]|nr:retrovirus-related Pol polyprotein from transposon TNT 1-94 [Sesbania bispinosa]